MYGMVNRAIQDLIVSTAGQQAWLDVKARAELDLEFEQFRDTVVYDDDVTYALVEAASTVLDQPPEALLQAFGRHWILYTGREGWGALLDRAGSDMTNFIKQLDNLHARVQLAMPKTCMPQFTAIPNEDGTLTVEYRSRRPGLAPMVVGLLNGLAEHFGESWQVQQSAHRSEHGPDTFTLTPV